MPATVNDARRAQNREEKQGKTGGAILIRSLLVIGRGVACRCAHAEKRRPGLWVSCCKRSIGIVPKRKIASINGGLLSNQNYRRSPRRVSRRCGSRPQTRQRAGNRWATILTITMTSASLIKKAACPRGSVPKPNYST